MVCVFIAVSRLLSSHAHYHIISLEREELATVFMSCANAHLYVLLTHLNLIF